MKSLSLFVFGLMPMSIVVAADRPDLIVVVSVDQWKYDYLERFAANLQGGIVARTKQTGVSLTNCFHQHAFTYTGPGHAVLLTGAYPGRNGIIANEWYERSAGREVYCVADADATVIGTTSDEQRVSPRLLLVDTVGDQLKQSSHGMSKVFGVAIKDRAAILMAGKAADGAYWMSYDGKWITSDHYEAALPGYLRNLNEQRVCFRYAGQVWNPLLAAARYQHGGVERSQYERPIYDMTRDFPHRLPAADQQYYIRQLVCSPFGNEATLEAARNVIEHEHLGLDAHPDLLTINLSSTDYVGHSFGPDSLEVEDMTYRTDQQLGQFAAYLDEFLPGRRWIMFITADHGVAPIPELAKQHQLDAARNPLGVPDDTGNIEILRQYLEAVVRAKLDPGQASQPLIQAAVKEQIYLALDHPWMTEANARRVRKVIAEWLSNLPVIARAVTRDQLAEADDDDQMMYLLKNSFHPERSGDVLYVLKPYHITTDAGTSHGSPWDYDRHVPLLILGNHMVRQGAEQPLTEVSPASIASTVASLLAIPAPATSQAPPLNLIFAEQ